MKAESYSLAKLNDDGYSAAEMTHKPASSQPSPAQLRFHLINWTQLAPAPYLSNEGDTDRNNGRGNNHKCGRQSQRVGRGGDRDAE